MSISRLLKRKPSLLSKLIKEERKKLCRFIPKHFFKDTVSGVYFPSIKSLFVILIFLAIFFILAHLEQILYWFDWHKLDFLVFRNLSLDSSYYQNLIAIHAGIGVIIFALVIFIAESLRGDETNDRARVLLKESYLFPLAVAEILVFLIFIFEVYA